MIIYLARCFVFIFALTLMIPASLGSEIEGKRQAVVVGLSSYSPPSKGRSGISHLPSVHRDAERLSARLKELGWEVKTLTSLPGATLSEAKKDLILRTLEGVGRSEADTVLFAFSGHGFRVNNRDYLTAFDSHYIESKEGVFLNLNSLIDIEKEIGEVFGKMPARRRLMVVDACRDVPDVDPKGQSQVADPSSLADKLGEVVGLSKEHSVYSGVLFSCAPGERSFVDPKLDGGRGASVFTEGLLNALSDKKSLTDGELRPEGLAVQTAQFVANWSGKSGKRMRPRWVASPENDLGLGLSLGRLESVSNQPGPTKNETRQPSTSSSRFDYRKEPSVRVGSATATHFGAFLPDGRFAAGGKDSTISILNDNGSTVRSLTKESKWVNAIATSPDGSMIASASSSSPNVNIWDARNGRLLHSLVGHGREVRALTFSPDGTSVASASMDATVRVWDVKSGNPVTTFQDSGPVHSVSYSGDGRSLVSGGNSSSITIWRIDSGKKLQLPSASLGLTTSVCFSPDGSLIASGHVGSNSVYIWKADSGQKVATFTGHLSWIVSVAFSPDGKHVASGSVDRTVRLWDVESGELTKTLAGHNSALNFVTFSRDGAVLASGSTDTTIRFWRF